MRLTNMQAIGIMLAVTFGAVITRFTPFIIFPENRPIPNTIIYLGRALPAAMMGLLVVYCFKNVSFIAFPYGAFEIIAVLSVIILHKLKGNALISIAGSTVIYMLLVQNFF